MDGSRPVSKDSFAEMGGQSLYEREDWPLVHTERALSPDTVIHAGGIAAKIDDGVLGHDAEAAKVEDQDPAVYLDHDVSAAEESDDDSEGVSTQSIRTPSPPTQSPRGRALNSRNSSSPAVSSQESDLPSPERNHDVSPVRSETEASSQGGGRRQGSQNDVSPVRSERSHEGAHEDDEHLANGVHKDDNDTDDSADDHEETNSLYEDERRDIATPIAFGHDSTTDAPSPNPPTPLPAYSRQIPSASVISRQGSTAKGSSTSRHAARPSSMVMANNRRSVRYSWQSFHEQEPNRPKITIVKLYSDTVTASAGFPTGEALGFSISPNGRRIACYNSARLYILQTAALPVGLSQDYGLKRRPLAVEIVDDGNVLAILADTFTINIYDTGRDSKMQRIRTIKVDFPTTCIALAPMGGLLAAAYEGGMEIFSLARSALPTDRRAVKSQKMDRLSFSEDGSTLLGTTTRINAASTVVVSVAIFPASPNGPTPEELKEAWCSVLLEADNIRNSSHAVFMRGNNESFNDRLLAWNGLGDTFGVLDVDNMQYGNISYPIRVTPPLSSMGGLGAAIHSCPTIDEKGDTVAMVVNDRTVRLYIIPHKMEDEETPVDAHCIDHELDEGYGLPFSDVRWLRSNANIPPPHDVLAQTNGRLIVASPGGVLDPTTGEPTIDEVEGGRIILFDFDPELIGQAGQTLSLSLGACPSQELEEPELDVAHEVALVRRRTVNQNRAGTLNQRPYILGRAATSTGDRRNRPSGADPPSLASGGDRRSILSVQGMQPEATRSLPDLLEISEGPESPDEPLDEPYEEPYAQNAPRSQASLQRAASNAQRHRFQTIEERNQERVSADTSANFIALPEYTEEPNAPLPTRFRTMAGLDAPAAGPKSRAAIVTSEDGDRAGPSTRALSPTPEDDADAVDGATMQAAAEVALSRRQRSRDGTNSPAAMAGAPRSPAARSETVASFASLPRSDTSTSFGPVARSDTFQSLGPLPRSIQRAYDNHVPPFSAGAVPNNFGTFGNVNAGPRSEASQHFVSPMPSGVSLNRSFNAVPAGWDGRSPLPQRNHSVSPMSERTIAGYRHSTSQLNPPGHEPPSRALVSSPMRAPSSAGSYANSHISSDSTAAAPSVRARPVPPHVQSMRDQLNADRARGLIRSPHLFYHTTDPNALGMPANPIILDDPESPRARSRRGSTSSRRSGLTETIRNPGSLFRRRTRKATKRAFGPEFANQSHTQNHSDSRSVFTKRDGGSRCTIM